MRPVSTAVGATVLGLIMTVTVSGCDAVWPSEAEARRSETVGAAPMDISGTWLLNEEESDTPRPRNHSDRLDGKGKQAGGDLNPPGIGGGLPGAEHLNIEQTDGEVTFRSDGVSSRTLITDGSWRSLEGAHGTLRVRASWTVEGLVVEAEGQRGILMRTYAIADDGNRLLVTSRIENGPRGQPVELTRVFDRAPGG